ncbi:hypothetical protein [Mariniluteicoccus flavus]
MKFAGARPEEVRGKYGTPAGVGAEGAYDVTTDSFKMSGGKKLSGGLGSKNVVTVERTEVQVRPPSPAEQREFLDKVRISENERVQKLKDSSRAEDPGALTQSPMRLRAEQKARENGVETRNAQFRAHGWERWAAAAGYSDSDIAAARHDARDGEREQARRVAERR